MKLYELLIIQAVAIWGLLCLSWYIEFIEKNPRKDLVNNIQTER